MSNSYVPLQPILVTDPITDVQDVDKVAILQCGSQVSQKNFSPNAVSTSAISFSCPPPSGGVIVSRAVKMLLPIRLTFTGLITTTDLGFVPPTSLLNPGRDAPRMLPFSNACESIQVNINNTSISMPMGDVITPLNKYYIDGTLRSQEYSTTAAYPDKSFNYSDLIGTPLNPLGNYSQHVDGSCQPRGGFPFTIVSNPTAVPTLAGAPLTAVVDLWVSESIYMSPFFFGKCDSNSQGFYNVNSMDFNMNFLSQAGNRIWAHCNLVATSGIIQVKSTITAITTQYNNFTSPAFTYTQNQPQLSFEYITPNVLNREKIGPQIPTTYPFFNVSRFTTDLGAISSASGAAPRTSATLQLSSIPQRIYAFARPSNSVMQSRCDLTDTYLAISGANIQWANQPSLLSSASQVQLYEMNQRNGGTQSWTEWSGMGVNNSLFPPTTGNAKYGGTGSILCLEMGRDIQLMDSEAPGLSGSYQLQLTLTLENMNKTGEWDALAMTLYIIVISAGVFTITSLGGANQQEGIITKNDVLAAQQRPGLNFQSVGAGKRKGGNFFDSLSNFGSKVNDFLTNSKFISRAADAIAKNVPHPLVSSIAGTVGNVARDMGYGAIRNSGVVGGRAISRNQLQGRG